MDRGEELIQDLWVVDCLKRRKTFVCLIFKLFSTQPACFRILLVSSKLLYYLFCLPACVCCVCYFHVLVLLATVLFVVYWGRMADILLVNYANVCTFWVVKCLKSVNFHLKHECRSHSVRSMGVCLPCLQTGNSMHTPS